MSPFEFFFSFYGLLLSLSVAVVLVGFVKALKLRGWSGLGYLTPLLALFILFDISTFWAWAWTSFRDVPFSYGLLVLGMVIALTYFAAASFVFPEDDETWASLDLHYEARKRFVFGGVILSNVIMYLWSGILPGHFLTPEFMMPNFYFSFLVITLAVLAFVQNRRVNAAVLAANISLYLWSAAASFRPPTPA
ncbi:MAG TPA: hypothetical protein VEA15_05345 [Caulobacteraceae bacterium]|nr:hypothetical protein [Caulobacteraceae bacterium]